MLKLNSFYASLLTVVLVFGFMIKPALAQTPADATILKPGQFCGGIFYNYSSADQYWQGDSLIANGNVGTYTSQSVTAGFVLGVTKNLDVYASLPFISNNASQGLVDGTSGIQDLTVAAKYRLVQSEIGSGKFNALVSATGIFPASDYITDDPYALGLGCMDGIGRAIVNYRADNGLYGKAQFGYHVRGNSTLARIYYYTDTEDFYSDKVDMPNAIDYSLNFGFISDDLMTFKAEAEFTVFNSLGGFDIRMWDQGFPSNEMDMMRIGANFQYYAPALKGIGFHLNGGYTLNGRNVWKNYNVGAGVTYFFNMWNKEAATAE